MTSGRAMNVFLKYQVSSFSHLLSPHPSPFVFQTVKCNHIVDLKSRGVTLNVASFRVNSVCVFVYTKHTCTWEAVSSFSCLCAQACRNLFGGSMRSFMTPELTFCPFWFSDSWIDLVTACERGGDVLIKASRQLLHCFVISPLCCMALSMGYVWIL